VGLAGNVALALQAVCEEITSLFDVDHVFIWLVVGNEIVGAAATGPARDEFLTLRRPIDDEHLLGARIVRERRPLYVNNLQGYADGTDSRIARAHGIQAVAGIPLIHGGAPVGAMLLGDSRHATRFREEDLAPAMLLGNVAATALYHASMHDQLRQAYTRTLETLGEALDARDTYTGGHSLRIARYANIIAHQIGCPPEIIDHIRTAALLHDVGKIGIPDSILLKPGRLNEREMEIMRSHSLIGARLLRTAGFPDEVVAIVRHLHEHYDGWGYPGGLRGDAIPLGSRILAVADAYEAMTSDRIYRPALAPEDALAELARFSNIQFDPRVVDAFIAAHRSGADRVSEDEEPQEVIDPGLVFAILTRSLLQRFGHFAGDGMVRTVVDRLRARAEAQGWILREMDGALDLVTTDRAAAADARRHLLAWLLTELEQAGGQRLATHLLAETVETLAPAARDAYRVLLSPEPMEDPVSLPMT
jgi:putative nucleotidyltransferase with HDIG domain